MTRINICNRATLRLFARQTLTRSHTLFAGRQRQRRQRALSLISARACELAADLLVCRLADNRAPYRLLLLVVVVIVAVVVVVFYFGCVRSAS